MRNLGHFGCGREPKIRRVRNYFLAAIFFAAVFLAATFFAGAAVFFAGAGVAVFLAGAAVFLAGVVFAGAFLATAFFAGAAVFVAAFFVAKGVPLVVSFLLPVFLVPAAFLGAAMPPRLVLGFFAADADIDAALFFKPTAFGAGFPVNAATLIDVVFFATDLLDAAVVRDGAAFLGGAGVFRGASFFFSAADFFTATVLRDTTFFAERLLLGATGSVPEVAAVVERFAVLSVSFAGELFVVPRRLEAMLFKASPTLTPTILPVGSCDNSLGGV